VTGALLTGSTTLGLGVVISGGEEGGPASADEGIEEEPEDEVENLLLVGGLDDAIDKPANKSFPDMIRRKFQESLRGYPTNCLLRPCVNTQD
jgi:hypothetical protein